MDYILKAILVCAGGFLAGLVAIFLTVWADQKGWFKSGTNKKGPGRTMDVRQAPKSRVS